MFKFKIILGLKVTYLIVLGLFPVLFTYLTQLEGRAKNSGSTNQM